MRGDRECEATYIPLEYRFTGVSRNFSTPEKSTISSNLRRSRAAHPEDRAVQEHVLAPGQLRMEAGPDLEETADAAANLRSPSSARRCASGS